MKVLAAELATEIQIKRFEREMQVLARLHHPNIGALYNAVHSENQLILLMEFIEGQTLAAMLQNGRLPIRTGIDYVSQILSALQYAHAQGVVHRDVTPSNVIVTPAGQVKLTDFGLSKSFGDPLLTRGGEILGTLPYLAPEQVKHTRGPDCRSDLFSVGVILYEILTGQTPFGADRRLAAVLTDKEKEPPPPTQLDPSLPPYWDGIAKRALARNIEERYQSAGDFLAEIARCETALRAEIQSPHWRVLGAAAALFAALMLALVAQPAARRFRAVEYSAASLATNHIPPPGFALSTAPRYPAFTPAPHRATGGLQLSKPLATTEGPRNETAVTGAPARKGFWRRLNPFRKKAKNLPPQETAKQSERSSGQR
jgi:serine/threonine-protein kinase